MATTPQAFQQSLLRPCVLHILRAAGYHSTRPSVLDTLTDIAARYMMLLAAKTAAHAGDGDIEYEITIEDIRAAMQDCGVISPEKVVEDEIWDGEEDVRGVENFVAWCKGDRNKEIRRIALEGTGEEAKEDFLTGLSPITYGRCWLTLYIVLKKKHTKTDEDSRYQGTILGKSADPKEIPVEGSDIKSIREWAAKRRKIKHSSAFTSRAQSSALSSLEDSDMVDMEMGME